ncbi:MAG: helix-turn-helix domain-containing protein [bacterium]
MNNTIEEYIVGLGFSKAAGRLYGALVEKGPLTILEASRATEIERTLIYRLIDDLTSRGLIEEVLEQKSRRVSAVEPQKIKSLLEKEKQRVATLEIGFESFEKFITSMPKNHSTQVRYFRGTQGIKQILWNETKAKQNLICYTYRNLQEIVGQKYFEEYARELEKNKVVSRDLRCDVFLDSTDSPTFVRRHIDQSAWRYLPESVMHLTHNLDVYNNIVAIYYWQNNDVFGIEIENQLIADMQRSIFETLWKLAEKYKLPEKYKRFERTTK